MDASFISFLSQSEYGELFDGVWMPKGHARFHELRRSTVGNFECFRESFVGDLIDSRI